jgi:hypothetical protein
VRAYSVSEKTGLWWMGCGARRDELTLISENGIVIRTTVAKSPKWGRTRAGSMMDLKEKGRLAQSRGCLQQGEMSNQE